MVIRRTIENLKERPHKERREVANLVAIVVVVVLLLAWAVSFFTRLGNITAPSDTATTTEEVSTAE